MSNFFVHMFTAKEKLHNLTIFSYSRVPQKKMHYFTTKKMTRFYCKEKMTQFYQKQKMHACSQSAHSYCSPLEALGTPPYGRGHVATMPNYGPFLILSPALKLWGPPRRQGLCGHQPACGPLLILSPTLKCWGPPDGRGHVATRPSYGPLLILSPAPLRRHPVMVSLTLLILLLPRPKKLTAWRCIGRAGTA